MNNNNYHPFTECAVHCSLCYNETECYECTQGYFLTEDGECQRKHSIHNTTPIPFVDNSNLCTTDRCTDHHLMNETFEWT